MGKLETCNSVEMKGKARNGDLHTPRSDGENTAQSAGSNQSKRSRNNYDKLSFPRKDIHNMMLLGESTLYQSRVFTLYSKTLLTELVLHNLEPLQNEYNLYSRQRKGSLRIGQINILKVP